MPSLLVARTSWGQIRRIHQSRCLQVLSHRREVAPLTVTFVQNLIVSHDNWTSSSFWQHGQSTSWQKYFTTSSPPPTTTTTTTTTVNEGFGTSVAKSSPIPKESPPPTTNKQKVTEPTVIYEGPFAALSFRLKVISITTAAVSIFGIPLVLYFNAGTGNVPVAGQLAVGGTAILAATGSTFVLGYCFNPYVSILEQLPNDENDNENVYRIRATTRNIMGMPVQTIFDPTCDDVGPGISIRPFCNFTVRGVPMYVHPELIHDIDLRMQLVGDAEDADWKAKVEAQKQKKNDDDELF